MNPTDPTAGSAPGSAVGQNPPDVRTCGTCGRSAENGYRNPAAREQCCDPCHGPYLIVPSEAARTFARFHGRRARRFINASRGTLYALDNGTWKTARP